VDRFTQSDEHAGVATLDSSCSPEACSAGPASRVLAPPSSAVFVLLTLKVRSET